MAKIVCGKDSVQPIIGPRLLAKVLKASIEDEGTDRRDFADGNPSLWRGPLIPGIFVPMFETSARRRWRVRR